MLKTRSILLLLLALLAINWISARVAADTTRLDAATMKAALRTTTIEEGGFIDSVLVQVGKGQIPPDLVDSSFQWARKKPYKHRFQYFRMALIVRADSIGIHINP
jgi:hypothetical protein